MVVELIIFNILVIMQTQSTNALLNNKCAEQQDQKVCSESNCIWQAPYCQDGICGIYQNTDDCTNSSCLWLDGQCKQQYKYTCQQLISDESQCNNDQNCLWQQNQCLDKYCMNFNSTECIINGCQYIDELCQLQYPYYCSDLNVTSNQCQSDQRCTISQGKCIQAPILYKCQGQDEQSCDNIQCYWEMAKCYDSVCLPNLNETQCDILGCDWVNSGCTKKKQFYCSDIDEQQKCDQLAQCFWQQDESNCRDYFCNSFVNKEFCINNECTWTDNNLCENIYTKSCDQWNLNQIGCLVNLDCSYNVGYCRINSCIQYKIQQTCLQNACIWTSDNICKENIL